MKEADGRRIKAILFDDLFCSTDIFISPMTAHKNLSFLMRLTLLIVPLVVMITHKHLHSKEPYSVRTKTNTRLVIIFPSQTQIAADNG